MSRPHLLYIAFWFPPSRASGVYRALATVSAFATAGWRVTVITTTREFLEEEVGSTDPSLENAIPEEVTVIREGFEFEDLHLPIELRRVNWIRAHFPLVWRRAAHSMARIRARLTHAGSGEDLPVVIDRYDSWIDPVVQRGTTLASDSPIDHVLATGNPYASFEAARRIGQALGIPFSVDYRDPWTFDVFTGRRLPLDRRILDAERRILRQAAAAFHVNEAIAETYRRLHPSLATKHHVAPNGFDADSLGTIRVHEPGTPVVFGILGTVNHRWPLAPIFDAWHQIRPDLPTGSKLELGGHLGYFAGDRSLLEARLPSPDSGFSYLGPVPKRDVGNFYSSVDIVVVPVPGGEMVTSGKIFEAMAVGKPFVVVQQDGGGSRRVVEGHPLAIVTVPDVGAVTSAMRSAVELLDDLDAEESYRIRDLMSRFERTAAVEEIVNVVAESTVATR